MSGRFFTLVCLLLITPFAAVRAQDSKPTAPKPVASPQTFTAEGMGPTNEDDPPKARPAVYSGVVSEKKMTLTVTVPDNKAEGGTLELTLGEPGRIRRCH